MLRVLPESLTWLPKYLVPKHVAKKTIFSPTIAHLSCQNAIAINTVMTAIRPMGLPVALNPK